MADHRVVSSFTLFKSRFFGVMPAGRKHEHGASTTSGTGTRVDLQLAATEQKNGALEKAEENWG